MYTQGMNPDFIEKHRWKTWQLLLLAAAIIIVVVGMDQLLKPVGDQVHKSLSKAMKAQESKKGSSSSQK